MQDFLLESVILKVVIDMLSSKNHSKVSLCSWFFNSFGSLSRVHVLNNFNSLLNYLIIYFLLMLSYLGDQLIRVLKCTFASDLSVEIDEIRLKLLLALNHGLSVKFLDICVRIHLGVQFVKVILYHGHLCHLLLHDSHGTPVAPDSCLE